MSAVGYFRVSTLEQASGNNSLPTQERKFSAFCAQSGLTPLITFTDKESARSVERPQFQKMLTYCRQRHKDVSCVIVADLSRFARNVADQGQSIAALLNLGIKTVSIDEPIVDNTAAGKLAAGMIGVFNQFFSDSLSEKTRFRMDAGVKQGRWLWVAPLGYLNDITSKRITVDKERAPLVVKAFFLVGDGIPIGDVLRQVTALGLNTRKGRAVPKQTFSRMLRNPFYAGWIDNKGTRVKGLHEALISESLFTSVQERLSGHAPHQMEHDDFPLRGFIRCAKCGKNLTAGWVGGRSKKYARYWCWTKGCGDVAVRGEMLETKFSGLLGLIQPEAHLLAEIPTLAAHSWSDRKERIANDSRALMRRLDEQTTLNQKAIKAKLLGELSEADFHIMKESITQETAQIQEQITALDAEQSSMEDLMAQTEREVINFSRSWGEAGTARKREIQSALFPEGVAWDSKLGYFCPANPTLIQFLTDILESLGVVGVPDGI
jgi:DNA invertase Pin-like site-specific DNA recombinase